MRITLPIGTKVRAKDGTEGEIVRASNTIWQSIREVEWEEQGGIIMVNRRKWYPTHDLEEIK